MSDAHGRALYPGGHLPVLPGGGPGWPGPVTGIPATRPAVPSRSRQDHPGFRRLPVGAHVRAAPCPHVRRQRKIRPRGRNRGLRRGLHPLGLRAFLQRFPRSSIRDRAWLGLVRARRERLPCRTPGQLTTGKGTGSGPVSVESCGSSGDSVCGEGDRGPGKPGFLCRTGFGGHRVSGIDHQSACFGSFVAAGVSRGASRRGGARHRLAGYTGADRGVLLPLHPSEDAVRMVGRGRGIPVCLLCGGRTGGRSGRRLPGRSMGEAGCCRTGILPAFSGHDGLARRIGSLGGSRLGGGDDLLPGTGVGILSGVGPRVARGRSGTSHGVREPGIRHGRDHHGGGRRLAMG